MFLHKNHFHYHFIINIFHLKSFNYSNILFYYTKYFPYTNYFEYHSLKSFMSLI
jgi:hypothetical protein